MSEPTPTILMVEDNALNMELAGDLLELAGFRVLGANTAREALALAKTRQPHLILMDISLPDMDGLEATRRLKEDPHTAGVPVVALTAQAMPGDRERALAAGCCGYIAKPIDTRSFAATVRQHLTMAQPAEPRKAT